MAKSTNIETNKRVFQCQEWILEGVPDYLILKDCVETWGISERQAKTYLSRAYKIWHAATATTIEQKRQLKIDEMKQRMRTLKDNFKGTPAGMAVLLRYDKEINKLEGLHPAREHLIKGDPNNPLILESADRASRINELLTKRRSG